MTGHLEVLNLISRSMVNAVGFDLDKPHVYSFRMQGHYVKEAEHIYVEKLVAHCFPDDVSIGHEIIGTLLLPTLTLGDGTQKGTSGLRVFAIPLWASSTFNPFITLSIISRHSCLF